MSVRDLILLAGGLFLIGKSVFEIHERLEDHASETQVSAHPSFTSVVVQIMILDIVFSLDSVITAVGMAEHLWVMIVAVILAVAVMMIFSERISAFIEHNPTLKMLALSFLILIGVVLVAEGQRRQDEQGVHLLCHGLFAGRGVPEYSRSPSTRGCASRQPDLRRCQETGHRILARRTGSPSRSEIDTWLSGSV